MDQPTTNKSSSSAPGPQFVTVPVSDPPVNPEPEQKPVQASPSPNPTLQSEPKQNEPITSPITSPATNPSTQTTQTDSGNGQQPPNTGYTLSETPPPQEKKSKNKILPLLILLLLVIVVPLGIYLVQQSQELRGRADVYPSPTNVPAGTGPVCSPIGLVEYQCPVGGSNNCQQCGSNNRWINDGSAPGCQQTDPNFFFCDACIYPNLVCYSATPSEPINPAGQVNYESSCIGATNTGNVAIRFTAQRCSCSGAVGACGTGCTEVTAGLLHVGQTINQIICYAGPAACTSEQIDIDFWEGTTQLPGGGGIISSSPIQGDACVEVTPSPPQASAQCLDIRVYQVTGDINDAANWVRLDTNQLSTLQSGDTIYISTLGSVTNGTIDRARIRVNSSTWTVANETSTIKPKAVTTDPDEYYIVYTIPPLTSSFTFGAEIHEVADRWY